MRILVFWCFSVVCVLSAQFLPSFVIAQDDGISEKIVSKTASGSAQRHRELMSVWGTTYRSIETWHGRAVVWEYEGKDFDKFASELRDTTLKSSRIFLFDFSEDYVEQVFRQDWYQLKDDVRYDNADRPFDQKTISLFELEIDGRLLPVSKTLSTLDFFARARRQPRVLIEGPQRKRREWPGFCELRLLGLCNLGQNLIATEFDYWMDLIKGFEPFGVEQIDENRTRLTSLENGGSFRKMWEFDIEARGPTRAVVSRVAQYRMVKQELDTVYVLKKPLFESRFHYKERTPVTLSFRSNANDFGCRIQFESTLDALPDFDAQDPFLMSPSVEFHPDVESALKDVLLGPNGIRK